MSNRDASTFLNIRNEAAILLQYLYMDADNYIDYENAIGISLRLKMMENGTLIRRNLSAPGSGFAPCGEDVNIVQLTYLAEQLKTKPAPTGVSAANSMWDYIRIQVESAHVLTTMRRDNTLVK